MSTTVLPLSQAEQTVFSPEGIQFFESKIRPLLVDNCHKCHGNEKQKGNLQLVSRETILRGGDTGAAIMLGDPAKSLLIEAVKYTNADLQMPPKKKLGKKAVADLEKWIRLGAPWPSETAQIAVRREHGFVITDEDRDYWAFQPVKRPRLTNLNGNQAPIDQLIQKQLDAKGIATNPIADKATLIRRAYFDLIGLPPTYGEVQAFMNDSSPDAWPRLIEHLLSLPQYGERWGRHWLDVVRFAQTNGYERDDEKPLVWKFRDYVIRAFNEDKPYDRFVMEQIAGDELPDVDNDSLIATGFYRLGVWDDEPDDERAAEFDGLDDMLKTTSETFMGLTVGCARCHDHMFDPISQQDYYEMLSFFRNVRYYDKPKYEWDSATYSPLISPREVFAWQNKKDKPKDAKPPWDGREYAMTVREHSAKPMDTHLLTRGQITKPVHDRPPARPGQVDCQPQTSVDRPRDGQSHLAVPLWPRPRRNAERLRQSRRALLQPCAARLAGGRVHRQRLVDQAHAPRNHEQRRLPPHFMAKSGQPRCRSRQRVGLAPKPSPSRGRSHSRCHSQDQQLTQYRDGRPRILSELQRRSDRRRLQAWPRLGLLRGR